LNENRIIGKLAASSRHDIANGNLAITHLADAEQKNDSDGFLPIYCIARSALRKCSTLVSFQLGEIPVQFYQVLKKSVVCKIVRLEESSFEFSNSQQIKLRFRGLGSMQHDIDANGIEWKDDQAVSGLLQNTSL
jgi:hypothetical protein